MSERDKKLLAILVPLVLVGAYWFLALSPKREAASTAATELAAQEQRRDAAQQRLDALTASRSDFAADYAELVRLGKAVPEHVDMPTLLVQLESAAAGTDIEWTRIAAEQRQAAPAPPPAPGSGDGSQPAAAGGETAGSLPGQAAETAGNTVNSANGASSAAEQSGVDPSDTQTSETARDGALPVGGGAVAPGTATATAGAPGLDTVPISLDFEGNFFDLAAFFHRLKRYVETSENNVYVRGRLLTVDGVEFTSDPERFPKIQATLTATAYLAPVTQGATAGATPSGPTTTPAATADTGSAPIAPTATATP